MGNCNLEIGDVEILGQEDFKITNNERVYIKDNGDAVFIADKEKCFIFRIKDKKKK